MNILTLKEVKDVGEVKAGSLIHGDCLEIMPYIQDESIDAIICDLPYG